MGDLHKALLDKKEEIGFDFCPEKKDDKTKKDDKKPNSGAEYTKFTPVVLSAVLVMIL